ncbi:MAG: Kelch repeat-containing protein [Polyangiales bacterium]
MRKNRAFAALGLIVAALASASETNAGWALTSTSTSVPHARAVVISLSTKRVLVVGGVDGTGATSVADVFDPKTKLWTVLKPAPVVRQWGVGVLLPSGKILITAGLDDTGKRISAAEVFEGSWTSVKPMNVARGIAVAANVPGGAIVAGGAAGISSSELYDETANTWTTVAMNAEHVAAAATVLSDGKILVTGGFDSTAVHSIAEVYDPVAKKWTLAGPMANARARHVSVRLPSGKVLVAGGNTHVTTDPPSGAVSSAEIYDPATDTWTAAPALSVPRGNPGAVSLTSGKVLVAGGFNDGGFVSSTAELFDPATGAWAAAPAMSFRRTQLGLITLPDGDVLAVGGFNTSPTSTAEIFAADNGEKCPGDLPCRSGFCVDGVCCDTACDGQCQACDRSGAVGTCGPVVGAPHGTRMACTPASACTGGSFQPAAACDGSGACKAPAAMACGNYACAADSGCKSTCATEADCATGFACVGTSCVPRSAKCDDGLNSTDTSTGKVTNCAPYKCASDGTCGHACGISDDCAPGNVCDPSTKTCTPSAAAPTDSGGGCTASRTGNGSTLALLVALLALRRRR